MMAIASTIAIAQIVLIGLALWVALRLVKSFGVFVEHYERATKQSLLTHESQLLIHQQNIQALEKIDLAMGELRRIHSLQSGAA